MIERKWYRLISYLLYILFSLGRGSDSFSTKSFELKHKAHLFHSSFYYCKNEEDNYSVRANPNELNDKKKKRKKIKAKTDVLKVQNCSSSAAPLDLILYFDGGCRGNGVSSHPIAGCGAILTIINNENKNHDICMSKFIQNAPTGITITNNVAEYTALIMGMKKLKEMNLMKNGIQLNILGDSNLVIGQLNKKLHCRSQNLAPFYHQAKTLIEEFRKDGMKVNLRHIYRDQNKEADALANEAMDTRKSCTIIKTKEMK